MLPSERARTLAATALFFVSSLVLADRTFEMCMHAPGKILTMYLFDHDQQIRSLIIADPPEPCIGTSILTSTGKTCGH